MIGLVLFVLAFLLAREAGNKVVAGDTRTLIFAAVGVAACGAALAILRKWRTGFYLFFIWMMFEDFVRKYMGNNLALFFGKDILLAFVYIALYREIRNGREKAFRPPFLVFLSIFVWLGVIQIFNENSPHVLYGLLGFKVYFYYVPLMFVGYALIHSDKELQKFLTVNAILAGVIGSLGIAQAILGNSFLNPRVLAPELEDLGDLYKVTPLSNQMLSLPDSVFVSSGRFAQYLTVAFILILATSAYLLLHTRSHRKLVFTVTGIVAAAALLSGSRGLIVGTAVTTVVLAGGFLWGAPWRWRQAHRLVRAIRRSVVFAALGIAALVLVFPKQAGSRIAYYVETLDPNSPQYELGTRTWDYPLENLEIAFDRRNWVFGNGIGTATLGMQYVAKLVGRWPPDLWVESGYGVLIVEMGIISPFLWLLWTGALIYYSWKIVRQLKGTRFAPIGFAIAWFAFYLLWGITFTGLSEYQNYTCNVYLWLLVGILFRLPDVLAKSTAPALVSERGSLVADPSAFETAP